MSNIYKEVADILAQSNNIVFFGGAGVSTECGIPDFRSTEGLYNKKTNYSYSPEEILSHSFFINHPDIFYQYLRENLLIKNVIPNKGHKALSELEKIGKLKAIITQNIDNLHQMAGSKNVLELHGTLSKYYCQKCGKTFGSIDINNCDVPKCTCGGIIRPEVVLYEEALDSDTMISSINYIQKADVLIVAGTSLVVYPAAGLLKYFKGKKMILINKDKTSYDSMADIIINKPFARTMMNIMVEMGIWNIKSKLADLDEDNYSPNPSFKGVDINPVVKPEDNLGIKSNFVKIAPFGEITPHTHDVVELFTVVKGRPHVLIDGDYIQVNQGTAVCAYPGEVHGVKNLTNEEVYLLATFKS